MNTIGTRIRELREAHEMNLFALSLAARIPEQSLRQWENGTRTPSNPLALADLAQALGTTTDYLITGIVPAPALAAVGE